MRRGVVYDTPEIRSQNGCTFIHVEPIFPYGSRRSRLRDQSGCLQEALMPDDTWDMERCVIVGAAGCGKTTLGKRLADHFESPFYDIDALFWKPGWVESQTDELRALTSAATAGKRWVI